MRTLIKDILAVLPDSTVNCNIYIEDGVISAISETEIDFQADKIISGSDKLATAGFINAHTHGYMTLFRNWADDLEFDDWLFGHIMPMEDRLTENDAYYSSMLGAMEMIMSGTTSYLDMHMFPNITAQSAMDSGMRAVISRGLSGGESDVAGGIRRMREAEDEIRRHRDTSSKISFMIAPHAAYTCDENYLRSAGELAHDLGVGINSHLSETESEVRMCYEKYGCSPVELYHRCGLLEENSVMAHCVRLSISDINLLSHHGVSIAINTGSNLKLANGTPPIASMLRHGLNLCFGTDSAASNNSLSILREMQLYTLVHKGIAKKPTLVPACECFDMATKNGAKALGFAGKVGELKVGMRADISIFDISDPGMIPLGDAKAALCYSSAGLRADTVMIDGDIVLENGKFTQIDAEKIISEVKNSCKRLGI